MLASQAYAVLHDLEQDLAGETGKFEIITGNGSRLILVLGPDPIISSHPILSKAMAGPFRVRKLRGAPQRYNTAAA